MRYIVVLDARSIIGQAYLAGTNEGLVAQNPCLDCVSLDNSQPYCTVVVREFSNQGSSRRQTLHIPHHAIAFVIEYAQGERPFGFAG